MTAMQMAQAVTGYLKNAGIRPGDGLEMMYQAVQAPALLGRARQLGRVIGADSNASLTDHIKRMRSQHSPLASRWLSEGAQQTVSSIVGVTPDQVVRVDWLLQKQRFLPSSRKSRMVDKLQSLDRSSLSNKLKL